MKWLSRAIVVVFALVIFVPALTMHILQAIFKFPFSWARALNFALLLLEDENEDDVEVIYDGDYAPRDLLN